MWSRICKDEEQSKECESVNMGKRSLGLLLRMCYSDYGESEVWGSV